ncbi:MAG: cupin domain-containing protein [Candidatus Dormibacteraeota bacterium]|nr:cupin domain-containing protein [Candidatus Dormibacteraeota bacterium]
MTRVGAEMVNPVSGERFVWRHTSASTSGEFAEFDLHLSKGAVVAAPHVHPHQREDFRVESGAVDLRVGDRRERVEAGGERSVSPGIPHSWGQAGEEESHVIVRLTPALRSEDFFETFCGLARDGKANRKGLPRNPLQLAVLAQAHRREFGLASRPGRVLTMPAVALGAWIGRRAGFRSQYSEYSLD